MRRPRQATSELPPVIAVAGAAGSGKTTLGRALAAAIGLPILDLDQLTNPLLDRLMSVDAGDHWLAGADAARVRDGRYAALRAAVADLVAVGQGCVLVAPFTQELGGGTAFQQLVAAVSPAQVHVIHLQGPPALLQARREHRNEPRDAFRGPEPPAPVPAVARVDVDARLSTHQQLTQALRALGLGEPVAPDHPLFTMTFDAVLFDLDGTLVDSTPAIVRTWAQLGVEFGFDGAVVKHNHGKTALNLLREQLDPEHLESAYARITELEANDTTGVTALPGAVALLAALPQHAKAIVTSGGLAVASARIQAAALPDVDVVVTADDVSWPKPDPQPYLLAAERLGVDPARSLVIEDAPAGVLAGQRAGCTVLAVGSTYDPAELGAELWLDSLDQIKAVVREDGIGFEPAPAR